MTRLARTYDRQNEQLTLKEWTVVGRQRTHRHPVPAGGLFSTAADLSKLYQMLLNDGQVPEKTNRFVEEPG